MDCIELGLSNPTCKLKFLKILSIQFSESQISNKFEEKRSKKPLSFDSCKLGESVDVGKHQKRNKQQFEHNAINTMACTFLNLAGIQQSGNAQLLEGGRHIIIQNNLPIVKIFLDIAVNGYYILGSSHFLLLNLLEFSDLNIQN